MSSQTEEMPMVDIQGEVATGFEAVREAFEANFERNDEVGAGFCLYHHGRKVVDLWGGVADVETGAPWAEDTLQLVFSTTKGATAIAALLLVQRGELDLDAPVVEYWPEFGAEGKQDIPVRWLLTHRSGLPVVDGPVSPDDILAWDPIVDALARQKPVWEPGTKHGYHALTYGWLVGEVVRRITGRSLGAFFTSEVAEPLGLEFFIGLPDFVKGRTSRLLMFQQPDTSELDLADVPEQMREILGAFLDPQSLTQRALRISDPALDFNDPAVHAAEIPAANGITTARSLARMYAATIGEIDGVRLLDPSTADAAITTSSEGPDAVLFIATRFGLGFMLNSAFTPLFGERSFGHFGAGGSLGFADPDSGIAYGYVMNKMQANLAGDARTVGLIDAVRRSLA